MTSETEIETRTQCLGQVVALLDATLDWQGLGVLYCSEGGEDFFCEEQRDALVLSGMEFARELGARLGAEAATGPGTSLYLGAAVSELFPALFEQLVLGRRVTLVNLDQAETAELNRGLALVSKETEIELPQIETCALAELDGGPFDHVWMTSVLTDPDAFPALHDHSYEREGSELATNRGDLEADREAAASLVRELFDTTTGGFWLTTTDEELPLIQAECAARALEVQVPVGGRLSGIVGDPVRHCYVDSPSDEDE